MEMQLPYEEDVLPPASNRGAGEAASYNTDLFRYHEYNQPTAYGDFNLDNGAFFHLTRLSAEVDPFMNSVDTDGIFGYDDAHTIGMEDLSDEEDEGPYLGLERYAAEDLYGLPSSQDGHVCHNEEPEESLHHFPMDMFLAEGDLQRQDWYDDPRGADFQTAFALLKERTVEAKEYLLNILASVTEPDPEDDVDMDPNVLDEVTYALSELHIPGLAKLSVEKLCDLLVKYPSLDLRGYLVDLDVIYIAYVIWGIDFYMYKKYGDLIDRDDAMTSENESEDEAKTQTDYADSIKGYWEKSLSWISEFFKTNHVEKRIKIPKINWTGFSSV